MRTSKVTATAEYVFLYDPSSDEFKQGLDDFRGAVKEGADEDDVIRACAHYFAANGGSCHGMIEGVGFVWREGTIGSQPFSGIWVKTDSPDFEYEID